MIFLYVLVQMWINRVLLVAFQWKFPNSNTLSYAIKRERERKFIKKSNLPIYLVLFLCFLMLFWIHMVRVFGKMFAREYNHMNNKQLLLISNSTLFLIWIVRCAYIMPFVFFLLAFQSLVRLLMSLNYYYLMHYYVCFVVGGGIWKHLKMSLTKFRIFFYFGHFLCLFFSFYLNSFNHSFYYFFLFVPSIFRLIKTNNLLFSFTSFRLDSLTFL